MKELLKSASKIVFLLLTLAVIVGLFIGKIDAKDFIGLVLMAYTFYFANKGTTENNFLGK
jgi:hypothetical protein